LPNFLTLNWIEWFANFGRRKDGVHRV
jgi:hypothetical protein